MFKSKCFFLYILVDFEGKYVIFDIARAFFDFSNPRRIFLYLGQYFLKSSFSAFKTQKFEKIIKEVFKFGQFCVR